MAKDEGFISSLKRHWNVFKNRDPTTRYVYIDGPSSSIKPDRPTLSLGVERNMVAALYNRIAVDCASCDIRHVRVDEDDQYTEEMDSYLNDCFKFGPNLDQTSRAFFMDVYLSLFDEGCIGIVPTVTDDNPEKSNYNAFDVLSLRTCKILEWFPHDVRVRIYNEDTGEKEELILPKRYVAVVENPLYAVMNEPNGTLKRLTRKINQLDAIDSEIASGKLDIIIQLPYPVKSEAKAKQSEERRKAIEMQLRGSRYGIAYIDGTEKVTQLNRPADNNFMNQIEYLTSQVYNEMGISQKVFDGTAEEAEMLNYTSHTIEPIVSAVCEAMTKTFLSRTARAQGQRIRYFRDPFKLVPVSQIADIADKFTRNEILSSNEIRVKVGFKPSKQEGANDLRNKNLNQSTEQIADKPERKEDEGKENQSK